jgi:sulfhydrogenase subunit alpha
MKLKLDVRHLSRVEGHGNIRIRAEGGKLLEAAWEVVETPRFFEVMLKGKHFTSAGILTARICGICSIGHCLASLGATEEAFGVDVPETARKIRLLAKHGETLQSHWLHLFFLAVPDFLRLPSLMPLLETRPEVMETARRLRGLGNRICDLAAGRTTHPVSLLVGGVARMPDAKALVSLRNALLASLEDVRKAAELFKSFEIPEFWRETEFVSLKGTDTYGFLGDRIVSSDGVDLPVSEYRSVANEYVTANNTSKWCRLSRQSYATGALARFNNNFGLLVSEAREVAGFLDLRPVCHNPFMNNIAQLVECIQVTHESIDLISDLLDCPPGAPLAAEVIPRAAKGVGAVEVPRGTLFHSYEYDARGRIVGADCVIPTTQNNANIHHDLHALAEQLAARGTNDSEMELLCSMLVRAYDPCLSCSVH